MVLSLAAAVYVVPLLSQLKFNEIWRTRLLLQSSALGLAVRLLRVKLQVSRSRSLNLPSKLRAACAHKKVLTCTPARSHAPLCLLQVVQLLPLQLWDSQQGSLSILPESLAREAICKAYTVASQGVLQPFMLFLSGYMCSHALRCASFKAASIACANADACQRWCRASS